MNKRRLYISSDIEGVAGVATMEHLTPKGFEYQQAREWMTAEVNAACEAAFAAGIEEIVVSDSHGNGQSLLIEKLPEGVEVVRSWPRPLCMMEGIAQGHYEGALLLGYHCGASDLNGVLAHTMHGSGISELRLNGQVASETVISAAIAAHFSVPVIMVSGDDAYIEHALKVLPDSSWTLNNCAIETVVTKFAASATSARMLKPQVAQRYITEGVSRALERLDQYKAQPIVGSVTLDIRCMKRNAAELLDYLPNVERLDAYTVRFIGKDMVEVSRFLSFVMFSGSLTPNL